MELPAEHVRHLKDSDSVLAFVLDHALALHLPGSQRQIVQKVLNETLAKSPADRCQSAEILEGYFASDG